MIDVFTGRSQIPNFKCFLKIYFQIVKNLSKRIQIASSEQSKYRGFAYLLHPLHSHEIRQNSAGSPSHPWDVRKSEGGKSE